MQDWPQIWQIGPALSRSVAPVRQQPAMVEWLMPTDTEKQRVIEALQALPENATIEDAIERLCFIAKIEEGLRQSEAGRVVDHEEVKRRFLS